MPTSARSFMGGQDECWSYCKLDWASRNAIGTFVQLIAVTNRKHIKPPCKAIKEA